MTWMALEEAKNFELSIHTGDTRKTATVNLAALADSRDTSEGMEHPATVKDLSVGQVAYVYSYGGWKRGVVTKIGRIKATITFVTRSGVANALASETHQVKVTAKSETAGNILVTPSPTMVVPSITQGAAPVPVESDLVTEEMHAEALAMNAEWDQERELDRRVYQSLPTHQVMEILKAAKEDGDTYRMTLAHEIIKERAEESRTQREHEARQKATTGERPAFDRDPTTGRIPALEVESPADPRDRYFTDGCGADVKRVDRELIAKDAEAAIRPVIEAAKYPPGTPEHAAYVAELRVELDKFARGEALYTLSVPAERPAEGRSPGEGSVVTIRGGGKLYDVLRGDGLDGLVRVAPCDPEDAREPFWVPIETLRPRQPIATVTTAPLGLGSVRETVAYFLGEGPGFPLGTGAGWLIRLVDTGSGVTAVLVPRDVPGHPLRNPSGQCVGVLRIGETVVVDGTPYRVTWEDEDSEARLTRM